MWKKPTIGEMRHRITIRRRTDLPVGAFAVESAFPEQVTRWAAKRQVSGATYYGAVAAGSAVTHEFAVRGIRHGFGADHEVVHGSSLYRVARVYEIENCVTVLECEDLGNV